MAPAVRSSPDRRSSRWVRQLVASAAVSALGDGLADVALALMALTLTTDARLVTGVYIAGRIPWLLFGRAVAGAADRSRRPADLMIAADVIRCGTLGVTAVFVATGHATLPLLYATAIVIGTGEIAHSAAAQVLLPHLAKGDALASANGQIGAAQAGGLAIVGPAVGGVVFSASRLLPFAADSLSFAASGALLVPLRAIVVEPTAPPQDPDTAIAPDVGRTTARRQITSHPLLRVLLVQMMTLAFAQSMVMSTLPIFGRRYLGLSGGAYGLMLGLSAIGNVVGSVVAPRLWQGRRTTVVLLIGSGLLAGAAYVVMAAVKSVPLAIAMLAIEALAVGIINTVSPTLRMEHAPVASRARVATTFTQILFITQPVGAVIAGLLARSYGVTAAYSLAGSLILAVVLLTDRALRRAVAAVGA